MLIQASSAKKPRVAIIGAGASGLPAIKSCLEEGLEPVCFERTSDIGGLWNYENSLKEGDRQACVMKSTIINSSKEMMCYSDFPVPEDYPNFMHNTLVLKYFRSYAEHFNLLPHIRFNTEVAKLAPADDFSTSGRWVAEIRSPVDGHRTMLSTETFDAVMVCTGHHVSKHLPRFEGDDVFKGERTHTHDFHDGSTFRDKRVVIIGIGNSAVDAAVVLSHISSQVYLSTRRGAWILDRLADKGLPADCVFGTRFSADMAKLMPRSMFNDAIESQLNSRFDHAVYGLKPSHRFDQQHPTVNGELANRIAAGAIVVKPNVRRFTENGVEFDDGSTAESVDTVIYGTGYVFGFPFIDHPAFAVKENRIDLFKRTFSPEIQPSTIAIIGLVQPIGSTITLSEQQCRLAARVFKGDCRLPNASEMRADIRKQKEANSRRFVNSQRYTLEVDHIPFMLDLARLTGNYPNLWKLLLTDPRLAMEMYFGPMTPVHMRVMGRGAWPGAREVIMTTSERVISASGGSVSRQQQRRSIVKTFIPVAVVLALSAWMYQYQSKFSSTPFAGVRLPSLRWR